PTARPGRGREPPRHGGRLHHRARLDGDGGPDDRRRRSSGDHLSGLGDGLRRRARRLPPAPRRQGRVLAARRGCLRGATGLRRGGGTPDDPVPPDQRGADVPHLARAARGHPHPAAGRRRRRGEREELVRRHGVADPEQQGEPPRARDGDRRGPGRLLLTRCRLPPVTPRESPEQAPYVPDGAQLREFTPQAVVLGVVLSAVLAGANAYLGLFAGMTVSASIPAAVLSMALLRVTKGTILENNAVQTAASAGESLAAGAIFTLPALILLGVWREFDYLQTTLLTGFGGLLGVLFTVPLRRALVTEGSLRFPEGVATAEVLKVGHGRGDAGAGEARGGAALVLLGGVTGALFKIGESGLRLWQGVLEGARPLFGTVVYGGANLSPALLGVGCIVGLSVAAVVFAGGALNWLVAVPLRGAWQGIDAEDPVRAAWRIWSEQTRYLGVGAMIVGGLWTLASLRTTLMA